MNEKRMLIVPARLAKKIDENRDGLSQADFIDFLIESHLEQGQEYEKEPDTKSKKDQRYVTKDDLQGFEQGIKGLLRSFLEFFVSYGLELGNPPGKDRFEELDKKIQGFGTTFGTRGQRVDDNE